MKKLAFLLCAMGLALLFTQKAFIPIVSKWPDWLTACIATTMIATPFAYGFGMMERGSTAKAGLWVLMLNLGLLILTFTESIRHNHEFWQQRITNYAILEFLLTGLAGVYFFRKRPRQTLR